jgi:hypothetical protein
MPENQDNQETEGGQNAEIDPELWLQVLLMLNADPGKKEELVQRISRKTGIIPENVEKIMQATLELMFKITRGN